MRQPTLDELMGKLESKYALVVAAAKRARMITEGAAPLVEQNGDEISKTVSVALEEIAAGKIEFDFPKSGIK